MISTHAIPPKRILVNILTFIPTAWVDARLIAERKAGFNSYLSAILADSALKDDQRVADFFAPAESISVPTAPAFNPEDALPSKFTREMSIAYLEQEPQMAEEAAKEEFVALAAESQSTPEATAPEVAQVPESTAQPETLVDASTVEPAESSVTTEAAPVTSTTDVVESAFVEEGLNEDDDRVEALAVPVANPLACAYYPDWSAGSNPPEKIDFSKFDVLFFAFVTTNGNGVLQWGEGSQAVLKRLVASAKKSGKHTKIVLSVGGWGGSAFFSDAANASHRSKLVSQIADALKKFKLDGVDVDWEYPNSVGAGNKFNPQDSDNLLALFKALRSKLGASKLITAAVTHLPWLDQHSKAISDVSAFAAVMSFVNVMNYDVWGSGANPGPNAPLSNKCGTSGQPNANAKAALAQWTKAGFPANKLLLGLPNYGYCSKSKATRLSQREASAKEASASEEKSAEAEVESKVDEPKTEVEPTAEASSEVVDDASVDSAVEGAAETTTEPVEEAAPIPARAHTKPTVVDVVPEASSATDSETAEGKLAAAAGDLSIYWNTQIAFKTLLSAGALVRHDGKYIGGNGFTRGWDNCSDTPFLFNTSRSTVVAYDDPDSIQIKADFARKNGMGGCFTWSLDQDDGTALQDAMRRGLKK